MGTSFFYNFIACFLLFFVHLILKILLMEAIKAVVFQNFTPKTSKKVTVCLTIFSLLFSIENWILPKDDMKKICVEFGMIATIAILELSNKSEERELRRQDVE